MEWEWEEEDLPDSEWAGFEVCEGEIVSRSFARIFFSMTDD